MSRSGRSIDVEYNRELEHLERLMSAVDRPGSYVASGAVEAHMPSLSIEGVGRVAFPVLPSQAKKIVAKAERAPYGRGEETLVDENVRKVWQIKPDDLALGGKHWNRVLHEIVSNVARGLGAGHLDVSAELYKLLVYDEGSFFISHRDTQKTAGMFGTLVVVLPSYHEGGDLIVRHAGRETKVGLSVHDDDEDVGVTLRYAAFYADCEHEILPVASGYRICLVYNLVHAPRGKRRVGTIERPNYRNEIAAVASTLSSWRESPRRSTKIVYLLEHQYTPAGLGFAGLKNGDAAIAGVFVESAAQASCVVYLGIVHIEESGSAEVFADGYGGSRGYGRSRWGYRERIEIEDPDDDDYELIEIHDSRRFIDSWVNPHDKRVEFGELPLGEEELLPVGALDGEPPDELRVSEATGNEGGSLERAYHRTALVVWPEDAFADVLLQGGVESCVPHFAELVGRAARTTNRSATAARAESIHEEARSLAEKLIGAWSESREARRRYAWWYPGSSDKLRAARRQMTAALVEFGEDELLERFLESVMVSEFDGSEVTELGAAFTWLASRSARGAKRAGAVFAKLVESRMAKRCRECIRLLAELVRAGARSGPSESPVATARYAVATALVEGLARAVPHEEDDGDDEDEDEDEDDWREANEERDVVSPAEVVELVRAVHALRSAPLAAKTVDVISRDASRFPPDKSLVPALEALHEKHGIDVRSGASILRLWTYATEFLLERSEFPPEEPSDWKQEAKLGCKCELCRELARFASDASAKVHRFPARQDLRRHLHSIIERSGLDMDHVTERRGRPYTLVCTKNRKSFRARVEQYREDVRSLRRLVALGDVDGLDGKQARRAWERADEAVKRARER